MQRKGACKFRCEGNVFWTPTSKLKMAEKLPRFQSPPILGKAHPFLTGSRPLQVPRLDGECKVQMAAFAYQRLLHAIPVRHGMLRMSAFVSCPVLSQALQKPRVLAAY